MYAMVEASNQQRETTVQMDDTVFGEDMEAPHMDDGQSAEIRSWSGERAASSTSGSSCYYSANTHTATESDEYSPTFLFRILAFFSCCFGNNTSVTDTAGGFNMNDLHMEDGNSLSESSNATGERAAEQTEDSQSVVGDSWHSLDLLALLCKVQTRDNDDFGPRRAGNLSDEIEEFIPVVYQFYKNIIGTEAPTDTEESLRNILPSWNAFLQWKQGIQHTSAIISSDTKQDVHLFIIWEEIQQGAQLSEGFRGWIKEWLPEWNMFLQAREGEAPVTRLNLFLTIVGFILYIVDMGSDIGTAIFFASNGQWWQAIVTLAIVYGAVIIHTALKWRNGHIHCTGAADWLRYVASLLVNWQDVKLYGALCRLEWQLHKSPTKNAHLVPGWHQRRIIVALLKWTEGMWEACPQAILQLCLLVPDLYGTWTWTDYLRIFGASVSLCTAGAALVNLEKFRRISIYTDLPLSELVVLHVWAVPVTVSRLLCLCLLLSVHPYWALAGVAPHLVLHSIAWCRTKGVPRARDEVIFMCLETIKFCLSPFAVDYSIKYRRVYHVIHLLVNTAATVVWALGTPLECAHPALYTAIICFNAVMFALGIVGWQLHEKHWPNSYPWHSC